MRLLSFLSLVQDHLALLRPEHATGWVRRVSFHTGAACFSHPSHGLTLTLRGSPLADGQHNLNASWHGVTGEAVSTRSFYSGAPGFRWETAAQAVADTMPAPILPASNPAPTPEILVPQRIPA